MKLHPPQQHWSFIQRTAADADGHRDNVSVKQLYLQSSSAETFNTALNVSTSLMSVLEDVIAVVRSSKLFCGSLRVHGEHKSWQ